MNLPLSRVYFNPRTKTTTYLAFNPTDKMQMASAYKSGRKIGVLRVPPREMVTANQLARLREYVAESC